MKKLLLALFVLCCAGTLIAQQGTARPRFGSLATVPATPVTSIISPTTSPTFEVSVAAQLIEVLCTDDAGDCTAVTWTCAACVGAPTDEDATQGVNGLTWTFTPTLTCSAGAGTVNTITVTGSDGTLTSQDVLAITCTTPDGGPPVVAITTNNGADFGVATTTTLLAGTATDDVGVVTLACVNTTTSGTCAISTVGAPTAYTWTAASVPLQEGANTIEVCATDQAANEHCDSIVVTRTTPLGITSGTLSSCVEDVFCTLGALQAVGGTPPYSWDNNGAGTTLNDGDADCTGMTIAANGVISGTPNPAAVPATCSFTARVNDGDTTDTQALTLTIVSASAETRHTYFEYQTSTRGAAAADNTGTNKILQFDDCAHVTYADYGGCRFSEDRTGTITMTVALAKAQVAGMQPSTPLDRDMGTIQNFTFGYDADTYANKQLGAKVIIAGHLFGDGLCDSSASQAGCPGLRKDENLELTFASIPISNGVSGTATFVAEEFFTDQWASNGVNGESAGTDVISDCGGLLGTRNMRKTYRIDMIGKKIWLAWKTDVRQDDSNQYFFTGGSSGFFECGDNVVGTAYTSGQNGEAKAFAENLVSPKTIGVVDYDGGVKPSGKGAFALTTGNHDFPVMHSRWSRRILHIEYGVPANSSKFNDWRDDCDQRDRVSTPGSFEMGAAVDQSAVPGTADYKCANMLTNDPATAAEAGECATKDTDLTLCSIADQDENCDEIDEEGCTSLWTLISSWICDEVRGCQRTAWRVPWWNVDPADGSALAMRLFQVEYDSSTSACGPGCGNAIFYQGPVFAIVNIDAADIDDTGCPSACLGDVGAVNSNLFRKPVR